MAATSLDHVSLLGMPLARVDENGLLDHIFGELAAGRGGWLITANLDFLRRYDKEPTIRDLYGKADVLVADGMPLVWATRLQGDPLPERVAGSALIYRFAERAAREQRSVYFFGGDGDAGANAARVLAEQFPGLQVVGHSSPRVSAEPTEIEIASAVAELRRKKPQLLLVGLGSPKQERLIQALRTYFPHMWMVGVGISFSYVSGQVSRAPAWMRKSGLEWTFRLAQEPKRLARRYLIEDLPFAAELFGRALWARVSGNLR